MLIPSCEPFITDEDRAAVDAALRAGHVALGPEVEAFEQAVADRTGIPHAVAVSSGSMALILACKAVLVFQPGEPVTVPTLTFAASAEALIHAGCVPDFCEQGWATWLSVNFYGHPPASIGPVYDCAEGLGSSPISGPGYPMAVCLSFNGNKIITAGGGGMVLTKHALVAARIRSLASHERSDPVEWQHSGVGYNARLSAFQAALGLSQLRRLDEHVARKRETAAHYAAGLPAGASLLTESPGTTSNYWMPVVLLDREALPVIRTLQAQGIGARPLWTPLHRLAPYRGYRAARTPVAEDLWQRGLLLPCSVGITPEEREAVLAALRGALERGTGH